MSGDSGATDRANPHAYFGLHAGFLRSCESGPDAPCLDVGGAVLSYREVHERARQVGATIHIAHAHCGRKLCGVVAFRSAQAYIGILGSLCAGFGVVPLNPTLPAARLQTMIESAGLSILVLDRKAEEEFDQIFAGIERPLTFLLTGGSDADALRSRSPWHRFITVDSRTPPAREFAAVRPDDWAYLFFTSGSTGVPKGVGVLHRNAARFVEMTIERYAKLGLGPGDRFSQFYELSFDSSMFDLYVCWAVGGCLCCPSSAEWLNPTKVILKQQLTVIDIVPSTGHAMNRNDALRANRFPHLRLVRFGGEALAARLCERFAAAAPDALVDNAYGPTEATVDACHYTWDRSRSAAECQYGMVPIGYAAPAVKVMVVDADLREVAKGDEGELLLAGPQLTPGYWRDEEKTRRAFVRVPGEDEIYYRTGDLVRRPVAAEPMLYRGRLDHQIKVFGVRIELSEVEMAVREAAQAELAIAVGWPVTSSGAAGIVAFVVKPRRDIESIKKAVAERLPSVMAPRRLEILDSIPVNTNGKADRKALLRLLETSAESHEVDEAAQR